MPETNIFDKVRCCLVGGQDGCTGNCITTHGTDVKEDICTGLPNTMWNYMRSNASGKGGLMLQSKGGLCMSASAPETLVKCDPADINQLLTKTPATGEFAVNTPKSFNLVNADGKCFDLRANNFTACDPRVYGQVFAEHNAIVDGKPSVILQNTYGVCVPCSMLAGTCDEALQRYCIDMSNLNTEPRCVEWFNNQPPQYRKDVCTANPSFEECKSGVVPIVVVIIVVVILIIIAVMILRKRQSSTK